MSSLTRLRMCTFTNGRNSPSARFRIRQHIGNLAEFGVDIVELQSKWPGRLGRNTVSAIGKSGFAVGHRACDVLRSYQSSASLLQRWMLSRFPTFEFLTRKPRVLDVDDAIWQDSGPASTRWLATRCSGIICGNTFLAERFADWNSNTVVVPTAVDTGRFRPGSSPVNDGPEIICWSGSSSTLRYLYGIEKALAHVLERNPKAKLRVICDIPPKFTRIPISRIEFVEWSEEQEVRAIQDCDVGLMPLEDSEWARGKCSFKMLCYMACGIPTVVSPVGMNNQVLALGQGGLAAVAQDDWVDALDSILKYPITGRSMGVKGRSIVEEHYSLRVLTPKLADALRWFAEVI
jgi:glycosyltransferase involved in cell wall biosynthesis